MAREVIETESAPTPVGPYSQAVVADNTIYVAGQGPIDSATGQLVLGTFEEQAELTLRNVGAILEAAGSSMRGVAKVTVYLANLADFAKLNAVYKQHFAEPYPARATLGANLLFDTLIEIDCIAVRENAAGG